MTSATPITVDQELLDKISDRLARSPLSPLTAPRGNPLKYANGPDQRAYVQNPYDALNTTGIKRGSQEPPRAPQSEILWSAEKISEEVEADARRDPPRKSAALIPLIEKSFEDRQNVWLSFAKLIAESPNFCGYCNLYATATVGILVAVNSPLPAGTSVEFVGSGTAARGHMFVVVNRAAGSDINDSATWGSDYVVVDYWYALQKGVAPLFWPKKQDTDFTDFMHFMSHQGEGGTRSAMNVHGAFVAKAYRSLSVRPLAKGLV